VVLVAAVVLMALLLVWVGLELLVKDLLAAQVGFLLKGRVVAVAVQVLLVLLAHLVKVVMAVPELHLPLQEHQ
jgi:hypothetical protein